MLSTPLILLLKLGLEMAVDEDFRAERRALAAGKKAKGSKSEAPVSKDRSAEASPHPFRKSCCKAFRNGAICYIPVMVAVLASVTFLVTYVGLSDVEYAGIDASFGLTDYLVGMAESVFSYNRLYLVAAGPLLVLTLLSFFLGGKERKNAGTDRRNAGTDSSNAGIPGSLSMVLLIHE